MPYVKPDLGTFRAAQPAAVAATPTTGGVSRGERTTDNSEILRGKRKMGRKTTETQAGYFQVDPGLFFAAARDLRRAAESRVKVASRCPALLCASHSRTFTGKSDGTMGTRTPIPPPTRNVNSNSERAFRKCLPAPALLLTPCALVRLGRACVESQDRPYTDRDRVHDLPGVGLVPQPGCGGEAWHDQRRSWSPSVNDSLSIESVVEIVRKLWKGVDDKAYESEMSQAQEGHRPGR